MKKTSTSSATLTTLPIVPYFTYHDPITHIEAISSTSETIYTLEQSIADLEIQRQHLDILYQFYNIDWNPYYKKKP